MKNITCPICGASLFDANGGTAPYSWDQYDDILEVLNGLPEDESITIVGHSYGGDTAYLLARDLAGTAHSVDVLITIDPAAWLTWPQSIDGTFWANVVPTGWSYSWNDFIAAIGGQWGDVNGAVNIHSPGTDHNDVAEFMTVLLNHIPELWPFTHNCQE